MEQRKIQKVGRSTLSVSLPKEWVSLKGVKQGDLVYLDQERDGTLRVLSKNLVEGERKLEEYYINCDLTQEPNLLERLIVGCYMLGVDVIKIFSSERISSKQIEEVRSIARKLIGLAIIEESQKEIILQCFIDSSKFKIYSLVQRLSVVTSTMLNEAMEALLLLDAELANNVTKREDEANNIYWLIVRLLLSVRKSKIMAEKIGLDELFDPTDVRLVSRSLEEISDCSESIAKIVLDLHQITHDERIRDTIDQKELEKLPSLDKLIKELLRKTIDSLFSGDITTANDAINLRRKLEAEIEDQMSRSTIPYFRAIAISLAMIAENSATIAGVAINLQISKYNSYPLKA